MRLSLKDRFIKICTDGYNQGWNERNGGNLSYRLKSEELDEFKDKLAKTFDGLKQLK